MLLFLLPLVIPAFILADNEFERIENGTIADIGQFPFVVAILHWNYTLYCTGVLISRFMVLTVAHKFFKWGPKRRHYVIGGDVSFDNLEMDGTRMNSQQIRIVKKVKMHPMALRSYEGSEEEFDLEYDLAIIKLAHPFVLSTVTTSINIAINSLQPKSDCITLGFATKSFENGTSTNYLMYSQFSILEKDKCPLYSISNPTVYCVKGKNTQTSESDKGGPLINRNKPFRLYGILTKRNVHTNVARSREWIMHVLNDGHTKRPLLRLLAIMWIILEKFCLSCV